MSSEGVVERVERQPRPGATPSRIAGQGLREPGWLLSFCRDATIWRPDARGFETELCLWI